MGSNSKAAIVLPTGFLGEQKVLKRIKEKLVKNNMISSVIIMPANIFAKTGTHVSILFLSNQNDEDVLLVDASKYGKQFKDGDFKKTILSSKEEEEIIEILNQKK